MDSLHHAFLKLIVAPGLTLIVGYVIKERYRKKRREQHKRSIQFKNNKSPIILYLRSFYKDGLQEMTIHLPFGMKSNFPITSFEMKLDRQVEEVGKFYALANPEKEGTEIGAVREKFSDDEWETAVLERMEEACMIIFRPSLSKGTMWEFTQIIRNGYLQKTIITVRQEESQEYEKFRKIVDKWLPNLPHFCAKEMYISINDGLNISFTNDIRKTTLFRELSKI